MKQNITVGRKALELQTTTQDTDLKGVVSSIHTDKCILEMYKSIPICLLRCMNI